RKTITELELLKLKQEQERRYKLCAEQEKLLRERASHQSSIKQEQNRDALKKFYERKAKEVGLLNCVSGEKPSINLAESSEMSQVKFSLKRNNSRNSRDLIERIKAGYTIIKFIKYHITRQKTRQILSELYKLRTIENHLISLKSTNNNDIKDPIHKILEQLDKIKCDKSKVILARKNQILKLAQNMIGSLNEKTLNLNYSLDVY
ncbi:9664_t:CDS:1, partial [Cetraspora pellucida]